MTLSIWRYAHLTLALCSFLFLALASITGIILALDAINERISPYRIDDLKQINLAETMAVLSGVYPEISDLSVDHNQRVTIQGFDTDGNDIHAYINPRNGLLLGIPQKQTKFIQWVLALHRSLFIHNAGRFLIGLSSFLLSLIAASGIVLVIQRQKGIRRFFDRIVKENFTQYFHVVYGRLSLLPILILALSGTYLSMARFDLFPSSSHAISEIAHPDLSGEKKKVSAFTIFENTSLYQVQHVQFPFFDDPEEFYILTLKDRELVVDQFTGKVLTNQSFPVTAILERISLDLHTGRTNILWALILSVSSISTLFFIYSGFAITLKRRSPRTKNKLKAKECEFILLVGSENGSTLKFANAIHKQLLAHQQTSFLAEMNSFTSFPQAKQILIFTATHGLGDPPSNAKNFISLIQQHPITQTAYVSVVGFGSKAYPNFCGYAQHVSSVLKEQPWVTCALPLHTVNDKSAEDFTDWVKAWSDHTGISLATIPAQYQTKPTHLKKMRVTEKTEMCDIDQTFSITFRPSFGSSFTSGDLLAIYPANNSRERLYSIGKKGRDIHLVVKLHPRGLGSSYLYALQKNSTLQARILPNPSFHFPKKGNPVIMISNGTGIAPFLGMIAENKHKTETHLYAGFRKKTDLIRKYQQFLNNSIRHNQLAKFHFSLSREGEHSYVTDAIEKDAESIANLILYGAIIMICGSLDMQRDVEKILDSICQKYLGKELSQYKSNGQLLSDCY